MKKKMEFVIPVGIVSLLLIFLVLCLATFSLLSLSSASADEKLAIKVTERTSEYYNAVYKANEMLKNLDEQLLSIRKNVSNQAEYDKMTKDINTSWQIAINDSQVLAVSVAILYPDETGEHFYEITKWQVINTDEWIPDLTQPVYQK